MRYTAILRIVIPDDEVNEDELGILEYHFLEVLKEVKGQEAEKEE